MIPSFDFFDQVDLKRKDSLEKYFMKRADKVSQTDEVLESIRKACNEPLIYDWLFKESKPNGYKLEDARGFLDRAIDGWKKKTHFVFLIMKNENEVVGALDIKSAELSKGEIGYWISEEHKGLGTYAVNILKMLAKKAGYKCLFAQVMQGNNRSIKILKNNQFFSDHKFLADNDCCDFAYSCDL